MATNIFAREFRYLACQQHSGIKPNLQLIKRLGNSTYASFTGSFIYGHGLWCIYLSDFWLWHLGTLFFPPAPGNIRNTEKLSYDRQQQYEIQVTAWDCGQKRALHSVPVCIDVKPVCKPGWQGGPSAFEICVQRIRAGLTVPCLHTRENSDASVCVRFTKVCTICAWACEPGCIVRYMCTVMVLCVFAHRNTDVIICVSLQPECVVLAVECIIYCFSQSPESHLSLFTYLLYFSISLSFFYSVLLSSPSSSPHSSPRNWPVKHSRRDQRHFTKSTMTQPTQLLAHQKAVVAALTRPTVMWRQVSTVSATTRTHAALEITTRAIYTCQRGAASRDEGQTDTAGGFTCHHVQSVLFCH